MKRKISKNKEMMIPILNNTYGVVVCWGEDKFIRNVGKMYHYPDEIEPLPKYVRGRCYEYHNPNLHPIIVLPGKPITSEEIGTLAHEATHAVEVIFNNINEKNIGEFFAHSVGAIVREVLRDGKGKYELDK